LPRLVHRQDGWFGCCVRWWLLRHYKSYLAAFYIALAWGTLTYMLHGLEFKLDKLLDLYGISVSPEKCQGLSRPTPAAAARS